MSIALQADSSLPQGYILVNGTAAATVRQNGTIVVPTLSATNTAITNITFSDSTTMNTAPNSFGFKNRIINGDMRIDQRNAGSVVVMTGNNVYDFSYITDRFRCGAGFSLYTTTSAAVSAQQVSGPTDLGFPFALKQTVRTAGVGGTNRDIQWAVTTIETSSLNDLCYGTSTAKQTTLSFYVKSSLVGQRSMFIYNPSSDRYLILPWNVAQANIWQRTTINIPSDTTGGFTGNQTSEGLRIEWRTSCAGNVLGPAVTTWSTLSTTPQRATTGDVDFYGTPNATMEITGVQFEVGTTVTPFEYRPFETELALCQRYFEKSYDLEDRVGIPSPGWTVSPFPPYKGAWFSGSFILTIPYKVTKRAAPVVRTYDGNGTAGAFSSYNSSTGWTEGATDWSSGNPATNQTRIGAQTSFFNGTTRAAFAFAWTADAELR